MRKPRPVLFKWRHFEPSIILCAVRWYLRYSLSFRDVAELVIERGLPVHHTSIWRWVQRYAPELNKRCRRELKPTNGSWRVDETYIRVAGAWTYLYRAVDSTGATVDFWFSTERDAAAAKRLFQKALRNPDHPRPRFWYSAFDCFGLGFRATCFDGDLHSTFHRIFEGHLDSEQAVLVGRFGFVRFHRPT